MYLQQGMNVQNYEKHIIYVVVLLRFPSEKLPKNAKLSNRFTSKRTFSGLSKACAFMFRKYVSKQDISILNLSDKHYFFNGTPLFLL